MKKYDYIANQLHWVFNPSPHKYEAITDFLDNEIANIQLCRLRSNIQSRSHFFVEVDSKIHIYLLIFTINIS